MISLQDALVALNERKIAALGPEQTQEEFQDAATSGEAQNLHLRVADMEELDPDRGVESKIVSGVIDKDTQRRIMSGFDLDMHELQEISLALGRSTPDTIQGVVDAGCPEDYATTLVVGSLWSDGVLAGLMLAELRDIERRKEALRNDTNSSS